MKIQTVILAAGQSKRMNSTVAKPLMPLLGKTILQWILDSVSAADLACDPIVIVGHQADKVKEEFSSQAVTFIEQKQQLGTGHAVLQAMPEILKRNVDHVLVLCGDVPMVSVELIRAMVEAPSPSILGFYAPEPEGYGRLVTDDEGQFVKIVEEKDATDEQRDIAFVNSGIYMFPVKGLEDNLKALKQNNEQGEYYLTDVPESFVKQGLNVQLIETSDLLQTSGVNTLSQLAEITQEAKIREVIKHLENGVMFSDPDTAYIEADVEIAKGALILPFCVIRKGAKIETACEVGPFSHIREGTVMKEGSAVGNFTEIKKSTLGEGSKAKHLSYIGDAIIGKKVNVGAGTIFANYDGKNKHQTKVGDHSFIGSGTVLVAPVNVGENAKTGAGAIVTAKHDVPDGETVIGVPAKPIENKKS